MHRDMKKLTTDEYVDRLIDAADSVMATGRVDPFFCPESVHLAWKGALPVHFARLALLGGLRPPHPAERKAFLCKLEARIPPERKAS
jgi:hypothetical protein